MFKSNQDKLQVNLINYNVSVCRMSHIKSLTSRRGQVNEIRQTDALTVRNSIKIWPRFGGDGTVGACSRDPHWLGMGSQTFENGKKPANTF